MIEAILLDKLDFNSKLTNNPQKLRSQKAGGLQVHTERIIESIEILNQADCFDADYLARLRYDKESPDSFDGICNLATHLITDHKAIRTAPLNLNFVFANRESIQTQWAYLDSRLPYLLHYTWRVVEKIVEAIMMSDQVYLDHIERIIAANVLLWWETVAPAYQDSRLERFARGTREHLVTHCSSVGSPLTPDSLAAMSETGALPGESRRSVRARLKSFERLVSTNRL